MNTLTIRDGIIHCKIQQQDDSFVPMTVKDTREMRLFVLWVQQTEGQTFEGARL